MCGRYLLDADYEALIERYKIFDDFKDIYEKKDEIFPGQTIFAVASNGVINERRELIWGLKLMTKRVLINSRIETVRSSKLYDRFKPCVIPASGYYEWEPLHKGKCKITADAQVLNFAGLFDEATKTVSIITTEAVHEIAQIHGRMPLIIEEADLDQWLKTMPFNTFLRYYETKKTLKFSAENLEPNTQLSFFYEEPFKL